MNVRSLIAELQTLDQDLEVYFDTSSNYEFDIAEWVSEEIIDIEGETTSKVALIKNDWPS